MAGEGRIRILLCQVGITEGVRVIGVPDTALAFIFFATFSACTATTINNINKLVRNQTPSSNPRANQNGKPEFY